LVAGPKQVGKQNVPRRKTLGKLPWIAHGSHYVGAIPQERAFDGDGFDDLRVVLQCAGIHPRSDRMSLRRAQHNGPLCKQDSWGKRGVAGALQANKLGDVLEVLTENVLIASREHRHGAHAEFEQLLLSRWIVNYVNRDEVNALFRKKLFRS
jgi:hypothetical protein